MNNFKLGTLEFSLGSFGNIEVKKLNIDDSDLLFYNNEAIYSQNAVTKEEKQLEHDTIQHIEMLAAEKLRHKIRGVLENLALIQDEFKSATKKHIGKTVVSIETAMKKGLKQDEAQNLAYQTLKMDMKR